MTPSQQIAMFEGLVGDSLDQDLELNILNEVKNEVEEGDEWAILKDVDVSQTASLSDTYLTMKALPADFAAPATRGIFVGSDIIPYAIIPFEARIRWQSITHRYYIDYANAEYALCGGVNPGGTIQFFYQKYSPDLARDVGNTAGTPWIFPARFHKLLPYLMAKKYFAIDQGDKGRAYDDRWDIFSREILENMRRWNYRLRMQAAQNDTMRIDISAIPNVADLDDGSGADIYG